MSAPSAPRRPGPWLEAVLLAAALRAGGAAAHGALALKLYDQG